jgi:FKBP-type peptidyl-prolyl cis-trans isomerase
MKKNYIAFFLFFLLTGSLVLCPAEEIEETFEKEKTSYAFGMLIASDFLETGLAFDYDEFVRGFRDVMETKETSITFEEALDFVNSALLMVNARHAEQIRLEGEKNRAEGAAFLAKNAERPEIEVTPSGLQYEIVKQGSGAKPGPEDAVMAHYEGTLIDGTVFDSSYRNGQPIEFMLDAVIPGWTEGLQLMNEGSTYRFVIPSGLAYGQYGSGPIPPEATLIFTVELLSVIKDQEE